MTERIFNFDLDGKKELGFDTGLDAQAFAQAKMAQFITQKGWIVFPDRRMETWKASGVYEKETMIIWGPAFPGESLDALVRDGNRKDEALDAIRLWITARAMIGQTEFLYPGASGVFVVTETSADYPKGTLLFPPERLVKRCIEAQGNEAIVAAQQWVHPDLKNDEETVFSAGAMLYAVFCGAPPFYRENDEVLRQDIREGVFMRPGLAAPGFDAELAALIADAISPIKKNPDAKKRPSPDMLNEALGSPGSKKALSWFTALSEEELAKIRIEQGQNKKNRELKVKTRRFVARNTAILISCAALALVIVFGTRGYINHQKDLPNTKGMAPVQVAETYYGAFENLDHTQMEGCVINKAGKGDIDMVINLFVITRVRQAYETYSEANYAAQKWLDDGSPVTDRTVFGVTGLKLTTLDSDESDGEVSFRAAYTLWVPANMAGDSEPPSSEEIMKPDYVPPQPKGLEYTDILKIAYHNDSWRISEISRSEK
ncbi:hypothetical protein [Leadbettera azotonutricia]|uniref:Protein kinase domain-containing protein n=1 Tax=Leadbettera azotonutricia (strain ATCC BAA-888 / DSM 13862 / ZAS-9) TaxID=545695 RepID=F5YEZ0_LEAAZ|nr:hypothetical protein [Leadbettera azotonutricia]AEF80821.1 hypothetical protein TREAZ_0134 [Leadbettera azotonutricia ZAS-9]